MSARAHPRDVAPALSIVAPCFNEEDCVDDFVRRSTAAAMEAVGDNFEIVLVNDGSKDRTWERMQSFATADARVVAIRLSRNFGHQER